mgnify:CR=1 FL=1
MQLQVGIGLDSVVKKAQDLVEQSSPLYIMDNGVKRVVLGVHTKINSGLIFDDDYYYIDVATKIVGEDYFQTKATIRIAIDKKLIDAIHDTKKYKAKFVYRLSAICSQELEIVDIGERVLSKI